MFLRLVPLEYVSCVASDVKLSVACKMYRLPAFIKIGK